MLKSIAKNLYLLTIGFSLTSMVQDYPQYGIRIIKNGFLFKFALKHDYVPIILKSDFSFVPNPPLM